jgi:hypothetical protein
MYDTLYEQTDGGDTGYGGRVESDRWRGCLDEVERVFVHESLMVSIAAVGWASRGVQGAGACIVHSA